MTDDVARKVRERVELYVMLMSRRARDDGADRPVCPDHALRMDVIMGPDGGKLREMAMCEQCAVAYIESVMRRLGREKAQRGERQ